MVVYVLIEGFIDTRVVLDFYGCLRKENNHNSKRTELFKFMITVTVKSSSMSLINDASISFRKNWCEYFHYYNISMQTENCCFMRSFLCGRVIKIIFPLGLSTCVKRKHWSHISWINCSVEDVIVKIGQNYKN